MKSIRLLAKEAGIVGFTNMALLLVIVALLLFLIALPEAGIDTTPTRDDKTYKIVPALGQTGFPVENFCNDPLTRVESFLAPDASGESWVLSRTRDGVSELVVVSSGRDGANLIATHYYTVSGGQVSEEAFLTDGAWGCIRKKVQ